MPPDKLLSVRLRDLWRDAPQNGMTWDDCRAAEKAELDQFASLWARALQVPGTKDLVASTLLEIGRWRGIDDPALVRQRCDDALRNLKTRWEQTVAQVDARHVEAYYDAADDCIEELMWWHTLADDNSPLAYVAALEFAQSANCKTYLDFGSGVGSGALLFRSNGFAVSLADISSVMLSFCEYRFGLRGSQAIFIDLKQSTLPPDTFDFITAMDVFEHIVEPIAAIDSIANSLRPGGYIYGRFASEIDKDRPQHIVQDFQPIFDRFTQLGFEEVFSDDWLWGHKVFQKSKSTRESTNGG